MLSIIGLFFLIFAPVGEDHDWKMISFSIFGASLVLLYVFLRFIILVRNRRLKHFYRLLDHCAIYLLIAGSYTLYACFFKWGVGWTIFGIVWTLAAIGIAFMCFFIGRYNRLSISLYL